VIFLLELSLIFCCFSMEMGKLLRIWPETSMDWLSLGFFEGLAKLKPQYPNCFNCFFVFLGTIRARRGVLPEQRSSS
jgi:hypothetical protein